MLFVMLFVVSTPDENVSAIFSVDGAGGGLCAVHVLVKCRKAFE